MKLYRAVAGSLRRCLGKSGNMNIVKIGEEKGRTWVRVEGILAFLNSGEQLKTAIEERFGTSCKVSTDGALGATAEFEIDTNLVPSLRDGMKSVIDGIDHAGLLSMAEYFGKGSHKRAA